jgi:2-methylcitrate dehydratase PrpD
VSDPGRRLAAFVSELTLDDVPVATRDRAGLAIADTLGAIVAGSGADSVERLASRWTAREAGGATVLGVTGGQAPPHLAAHCNGTAGTVLELDEGHRLAGGHPSIHLLPALLADTESRDASRETLVRSFVAGYEVAVRTARGIGELQSGYHPHGVWGAVAGAAAVSCARALSRHRTQAAMSIAANYAQHTRFEAATEGATVRNGYAGMSNLAALIAVDQAEAGVEGLTDGIARHLELAAAAGVDRSALTDGLGERWELDGGYFKIHAACRYTHATLDAVTALPELDPDAIESISVETFPAAARLDGVAPHNRLEAAFSIPFAIATALRRGTTGPDAFAAEAITPETLGLAERVTVSVAEPFRSRAPDRRGARVTVDAGDERHVQEVAAPLGGEHAPIGEPRLLEKFRSLVEPVLGETAGEALWTAARRPVTPRELCALARP